VMLTISLGPLIWRQLGGTAGEFPVMWLLVAWIVLRGIHDKWVGRLVPAVCWGFFALPDDDRLTHTDDGHHMGG
ncbi:MAG: hypothetical protein WBD31_28730, partial [Rubripirellula sp.]